MYMNMVDANNQMV